MFKRKIYDKLLDWKAENNGKTALLIEGARRIGKTTVAKTFGEKEYKSYLLIDFSSPKEEVISLFENLTDLNYLFLRLQLIYQVDLYKRESLIIFDEVQLCPKARQAIKRLVADGRYDYIETGSLISIKKNTSKILIPSEETRIQMYPMDYEEFRWALNDFTTIPKLKEAFDTKTSLGDDLNRKLIRDFRLYMLVGGMPQAVSVYIATNNFRYVDEVKRSILNLYEEDFLKIDDTGKASQIFSSISSQLYNKSRYLVSEALGKGVNSDYLSLIFNMKQSKTVLVSYNSLDPNANLNSYIKLDKFKMYLTDTGLFVTLMFRNKDFLENDIYEKLLSDKASVNLGFLYENVVAQILTSKGYELYYHSWLDKEKKKTYEIDFLIAKKDKIIPIEVKSSSYKRHSSLDFFSNRYSERIKEKIVVYTKDLRIENDVIYLPVYMSIFL